MAKTKKIYVYRDASGQEVFRVDLENKKRPVTVSKRFKALRNAGYEIIEVPIEEKKKIEVEKE